MTEHGAKISEGVKKEIEECLEAAKKAKDSDDVDELKAKHEQLQAVALKIGQEIYGNGGAGASSSGSEGAAGEEKPKDDAEEAEYKKK